MSGLFDNFGEPKICKLNVTRRVEENVLIDIFLDNFFFKFMYLPLVLDHDRLYPQSEDIEAQ
jgi:hypothetical protein